MVDAVIERSTAILRVADLSPVWSKSLHDLEVDVLGLTEEIPSEGIFLFILSF